MVEVSVSVSVLELSVIEINLIDVKVVAVSLSCYFSFCHQLIQGLPHPLILLTSGIGLSDTFPLELLSDGVQVQCKVIR